MFHSLFLLALTIGASATTQHLRVLTGRERQGNAVGRAAARCERNVAKLNEWLAIVEPKEGDRFADFDRESFNQFVTEDAGLWVVAEEEPVFANLATNENWWAVFKPHFHRPVYTGCDSGDGSVIIFTNSIFVAEDDITRVTRTNNELFHMTFNEDGLVTNIFSMGSPAVDNPEVTLNELFEKTNFVSPSRNNGRSLGRNRNRCDRHVEATTLLLDRLEPGKLDGDGLRELFARDSAFYTDLDSKIEDFGDLSTTSWWDGVAPHYHLPRTIICNQEDGTVFAYFNAIYVNEENTSVLKYNKEAITLYFDDDDKITALVSMQGPSIEPAGRDQWPLGTPIE